MCDKYFDLAAAVTVTARIRVKAFSLEEAIEKSKGLPVMHESNSQCCDELVWVTGEQDAEAVDVHEE